MPPRTSRFRCCALVFEAGDFRLPIQVALPNKQQTCVTCSNLKFLETKSAALLIPRAAACWPRWPAPLCRPCSGSPPDSCGFLRSGHAGSPCRAPFATVSTPSASRQGQISDATRCDHVSHVCAECNRFLSLISIRPWSWLP